MICRGAATALIACSGATLADVEGADVEGADMEVADVELSDPEPASARQLITSLPQWVLQAQQRLALEPGQQRLLRELVDGNSERLREMRARQAQPGASESRRPRHAEMAALQQEFRDALVGILTAAQLAEWDALIEDLLGELHLRHAPGFPDIAN
jgi:hypothetical protein